MTRIVGLCGQAGAGKDTVADFLVLDHSFVKIALADPIKRAAQDWFGFSYEQLWGPSELRNAPDPRFTLPGGDFLTPRKALQFMGTEIGRVLYPDVWVEYTLRACSKLFRTSSVTGVVISDVRFKNEIDAIHRAGGKVVRVVRKNRPSLSGEATAHQSETEQLAVPDELFDHHLINGGDSLALLRAATAGLVEVLKQL